MMRTPYLAAVALSAVLSALQAQTPLHVQKSLYPGETNYFGYRSAAGIGDVNGDGVPDYAIGARREFDDPGYVVVYSGATGKKLATLTGNGGSDLFGTSVAGIGDVNGDGIPDLLVSARGDDTYGFNRGVAQVISGRDWSVIREHTGAGLYFGESVAALGDATGDGVSEYLVCQSWNSVYCFDGASGLQLWKYQGGLWDGVVVGPTTGDANGDGVADALIGGSSSPSTTGTPYVLVLDGATGAEIYKIWGATSTYFGAAVSWIGDLDGDGSAEFVACTHQAWNEVYDGASGSKLYRITQVVRMDPFVCGMGDQNGDGVPDFAADDWGPKLYSGVDGSLIHAYDPLPMVTSAHANNWLAPAGDLDGDGAQELLHSSDSSGVGDVIVYSSSTYPFQDLGFPLASPIGDPVLAAEGSLLGGSVVRTELSNATVSSPAFLVLGVSPVYLPFAGGTLVPSPDFVFTGFNTGGSGRHEFSMKMPVGIPSQAELYLQYWMLIGGTTPVLSASNAVKGVFP